MQAKNTAAHAKYEKYKVAKTVGEARELGADTRSLAWDYARGFLKVKRLEKKQEPRPLGEAGPDQEEAPMPVEDGSLDPRTSPLVTIAPCEAPLLRTLLKALEMLLAIPDNILDKVASAQSVIVIIILGAAWRSITGDASGRISDKLGAAGHEGAHPRQQTEHAWRLVRFWLRRLAGNQQVQGLCRAEALEEV